MRKVFLDELPRYQEGRYKGKMNWSESVNCKGIKFIYDDIEGELEIINYNKENQKLEIKYNNNNFFIKTGDFSKCKLGELLKQGKKYKYNIGDIIENKTSKIQILKQIRINIGNKMIKGYKYKCFNCNNIDQIDEYLLKDGGGCNVCCVSSRKVLKGYNDLWTLNPEIAILLQNPQIGYIIHSKSHKSEIFVCPDCGYEKSYKIQHIVDFGFSCPRCGDGLSYPNKFAFNLLEQLNIKFESEYNPDWIKPKRYDFYFEVNSKGYILEMDGEWGHGNENKLSGQTANETRELDNYKDKLAIKHGIEVIRINCFKSDLEYIKKNILSSKLITIFDLSKINWLKCHEYACCNLMKNVCELWNEKNKKIIKIAEIFKLNRSTIIKYLKQGEKLKWCEYDPKSQQSKSGKLNSQYNNVPVVQLTLNGDFIKEWNSITDASLNLNIKNISNCCNKRDCYQAGGFMWMYKKDYDNNKNNIKSYKDYDKKYNTKKIIQLNIDGVFIREWNSAHEVQRELNISQSNISACCLNKRKFTGGFRWIFKSDWINI